MEALYHKTSFKISKEVTRSYSTSFSLGISVFAPDYKDAIYAIYGYVRLADEIVDSFHGYEKEKLLAEFKEETYKSLERGISLNPVINSFQKTVNEYNIEKQLIDDFLFSMKMDLSNSYYESRHFDEYIYGSAEVVGLMCLKVFCGKDENLFKELLEPAKALGSAFQKVNFLRDIKSDIEERGRIYLPGVSEKVLITNENKRELEKTVNEEFKSALKGIMKLPKGVKFGVYSAYLYYWMLFKKIQKHDVEVLLKKRVRISNFTKLVLLLKSLIEIKYYEIVNE
ncbi:MAG: phytoene/squalene synthase family protein [Ignavibacteriales bacterium]|nr:MAG: phytoene/squalene synthase family protein [Ignavibacteriales bacterium]